MKTNSIFTLLFSLMVFTLCGQNIPAPLFEVTGSTDDPSVAIDEVIEDLDLTGVATNILYDRGWKLGQLENFDGSLTSDTVPIMQHGYGNTVVSSQVIAVHQLQARFHL